MRPTSETERRQKAKDGSRIDLEPHRLRDSDTGRQITTVRNEGNVRVWPSHGDLMGWHVASPPHRSSEMHRWSVTAQGVQLELWPLAPREPWPCRRRFNWHNSQRLWLSIKNGAGNRNGGTSKSDFNLAGCRPRQAYGSFTPDDRHGTHLFVQHSETHPIRSDRRWKSWINPSLRLRGEVS